MPSVEYFRRQADICLRLSLIASDEEVSSRLISMAREYAAKGDALAQDVVAGAAAAQASGMEDDPDAAGEGSSGPAQP